MSRAHDRLNAEHARAIRLFAWLDDIGRYGGGPSMLRPAWIRLAELLEFLAGTEQELFPGQPQQRSRPAGMAVVTWQDDVRAALCTVQRLDPGCAAWWNGVHKARSACRDGFTASQRW
ncbi:MAG TPA: hypothetical protein VGI96_17795 [Streptosporangiaceae bacterium]